MKTVEQALDRDKLVSGDRPSILTLGIAGAQSIKDTNMAIFMVDPLGRVVLMPLGSVTVLHTPRVSDEDLNEMDEDSAIRVMSTQGDSDDEIMAYLKRRPTPENT